MLCLSVGLLAAACGGSDEANRAFETDLPEGGVESFYPEGGSLEAAIETSELVAIVTVVGYEEDAFVERSEPEDPDTASILYDGVELSVEQVVRGDDSHRSTTVSLLTPVAVVEESGELRHRLSDDRLIALAPDAATVTKRSSNDAKSGRYLVTLARDRAAGAWRLYGNDPIARVGEDDLLEMSRRDGTTQTISVDRLLQAERS